MKALATIALTIFIAGIATNAYSIPSREGLHAHNVKLKYSQKYSGTCNWTIKVIINGSEHTVDLPTQITCQTLSINEEKQNYPAAKH